MTINKNLLIALLFTSINSLIYSYSITMKNETSSSLQITLVYAGGSIICPNVTLELKRGEARSIDSGACCTSSVTMLGLEGSIKGKTFTYDPPVTGFGIACRGFSFVIKQTADNQLIGVTN